uniref:Uncharacterized protein n=1 Tax=Cacopsylla melanoneura TaxID=428564 RepID=A0A8D9BMW3_9HEMI
MSFVFWRMSRIQNPSRIQIYQIFFGVFLPREILKSAQENVQDIKMNLMNLLIFTLEISLLSLLKFRPSSLSPAAVPFVSFLPPVKTSLSTFNLNREKCSTRTLDE